MSHPIDTVDLQQMADALMRDPAKSIWALLKLCREQREVLQALCTGPHHPATVAEKGDAIAAGLRLLETK